MSETSFIIYLDDAQENRYRHWHRWENGYISAFMIQYEAWLEGEWHPIVRYVSAHGYPHRDQLHPDGTQTKELFARVANADVLTLGQRDIMDNWMTYRVEFVQEMKR